MIVELRAVKKDGSLGEYLPDFSTLAYLDSATDVGQVTLEYPTEGRRAGLVDVRREMAVIIDGREPDNSRFYLLETDGNTISEGASVVKWTGPTLIGRLGEALIPERARIKSEDKDRDRDKKLVPGAEEKEFAAELEDDDQPIDETDMSLRKTARADDTEDEEALDRAQPDRTHADKGKKEDEKDKDKGPKPPEPPVFKDHTPGQIMQYLIRKAKGRGAIPEIKIGFTPNRDSNGKKWSEKVTQKWEVGVTLLEVISWLEENGKAEARMNGRTLNMYNVAVDPGKGGPRLVRGKNLVDGPRQGDAKDLATAVLAISDTGVHTWVSDGKKIHEHGRIEAKLDVQGVKDRERLRNLGGRYIDRNGKVRYQFTYGVVPGKGADPYKDFLVGDWVNVLDGGQFVRRRVREIAIGVDKDRNVKIAVVVNDLIREKEEANARRVASIAGKTASSRVARKSGRDPVEESDGVAPPKPSAPKTRSRAGTVRVSYDGLDAVGDPAPFDQAGVEVHIANSEDFEATDLTLVDTIQVSGGVSFTADDLIEMFVTDPDVEIVDDAYEQVAYVRFVAVDRGGDRSDPSDSILLQAQRSGPADIDVGALTADEAFIYALTAIEFTGTLIQTHADPTEGVKMAHDFPGSPGGGIVGYDSTGAESFRVDADTGLLSARDVTLDGIFRSSRDGPRVEIWDAFYPPKGQTWGMINFWNGELDWRPGQILGLFQEGDPLADPPRPDYGYLQITAPLTVDDTGAPATLVLQTDTDGTDRKATILADQIELVAETFYLGTPDSTSIDLHPIGTSQFQYFSDAAEVSTGFLNINLGGADRHVIAAKNALAGDRDLRIKGDEISFDDSVTGIVTLRSIINRLEALEA